MGLWGTTTVGTFIESGSKVAVGVSGSPTVGNNTLSWPPLGMMLVSGIAQAAGSAVTVNCVADDSTSTLTAFDSSLTSKLGYTYTAGTGATSAGPNTSFSVKKLVDPSGIFGVSTCNGTTTSGCGTYY